MKKRLLSLILLSGLLSTSLTGCLNPSESTNSSIIKENPSESEIYSEKETSSKEEFNEKPDLKEENFSSFTHSAHLIDELNKSYKDGNIVISGMSLDFALAMLMNGTNKEATEELESFLGMTKEEANNYYSNLYDFYNKNDIVVANSFWFEEAINSSINSDYIDVISSKYKSTIQGISMNKTGADIINKWVNTNTNGLINKIIDEKDIIGKETVLVNTLTFEGKWKRPYESHNVTKKDFTNIDGSISEVEMMQSKEFNFYENEKAVGIRRDYENENYYFVAILPKEEGAFNVSDLNIEELLKNEKSENDINANLFVSLPKIDLKDSYDLMDPLKNMNVTNIFDASKNNLSEMFNFSDPNATSYVSKISQNVVFKIDEDGTKASAATTIIIDANGILPLRDTKTIEFNRPFVCMIIDKENNIPLFIAKITNF
jgi:serpin B